MADPGKRDAGPSVPPPPGVGRPAWPVPPVPPGFVVPPGRPPAAPPPTAPTAVGPEVPRTRRDAGLWLLFAAVGFLIGQVVAVIAVAVAAGVTHNSAHLAQIENLSAPPSWYIVSGLLGLWVGFFVGPFLASQVRGTGHLVSDLGLVFRPIDLLGLLIGAGGQAVVALLYLPFISHLHNFEAPTTKLTGGSHGASFALIAVLTVVGAPFFEELFFRGLLFRGLLGLFGAPGPGLRQTSARSLTVAAAVVVDGVLFGLAHAELEQLAGLAIFGCILAFVAFKTQRLGMNIVAHASFNLVAVLAILSSQSGVIH